MAIVRRRSQGEERGRGLDPFDLMQELMGLDPFRELSRGPTLARAETFVPKFDVKETKDAYVFKADLPGIKEEDLDVSLHGNRLSISGKREEEKREEGETWYTYERSHGDFSRSFTLPEGVDTEHVNAELKEGVLHVTLPKVPEAKPKKISLLKRGEKEKAKA